VKKRRYLVVSTVIGVMIACVGLSAISDDAISGYTLLSIGMVAVVSSLTLLIIEVVKK